MPFDLFDHKHHDCEEKEEHERECEHEHHPKPPCDCAFGECKREVIQHCEIGIPVDIDPSATIGRIETHCCGDPIVECRHDHCDNTCRISITQKIKIIIPITYTVITCADDPIVKCCVDGPPG